jgi:mannose-6-phosphate isomerase-like protein (cupin superfamily)
MQVKRVVTGVDAQGKSIVAEETVLSPFEPALMAGMGFYGIWGTEGAITSPVTDPRPNTPTFFPGPGATRFGVLVMQPTPRDAPAPEPPDEQALEAGAAEMAANLPGVIEHMEPDSPGMHTTKTVDYDIVLAGTLTLELDDGVEVELPPGSCIVQNGTRHSWHNYGTEPAVLGYVLIGAVED